MKLQNNLNIDKTKGLIWYRIFTCIIFIRIFGSLSYGLANVTDNASLLNIQAGLFIKMYPYFSFSSILLGISHCILSVILFSCLIKYRQQCIVITKYIIILTLISVLIYIGAWYIDFSYLLDTQTNNLYYQGCIKSALYNLIILIPTYYYLKKRIIGDTK